MNSPIRYIKKAVWSRRVLLLIVIGLFISPTLSKAQQVEPDPFISINRPQKSSGIMLENGNRFNEKYRVKAENSANNQVMQSYVPNLNKNYQDFATLHIGAVVSFAGLLRQFAPAVSARAAFLRIHNIFSYLGQSRFYIEIIASILFVAMLLAVVWTFLLWRKTKHKIEELQHTLNGKETLLREIHHRIKNNLAIISGLIELQSSATDNKEAEQVLRESQMRIISMARVHERLYQSPSLDRISMQTYLDQLAKSIHSTFAPTDTSVDLKVSCDEVELDADQVVPLGLLVNELLVNAFKHAFRDRAEGTVWLQLQKKGETVKLKVEDDGVGLPENFDPDQSDSLGMLLITTFSDQLRAEKTIKNTPGACFIFEFPANP